MKNTTALSFENSKLRAVGILRAALRRRSSYSRQRPTLPRRFQRSTIGAEGLNFRVRDGNGCDSLATITQKLALPVARSVWLVQLQATGHKPQAFTTETQGEQEPAVARTTRAAAPSKSYGQAERAISSGKLRPLLDFHIRPIKQVVFLRPS